MIDGIEILFINTNTIFQEIPFLIIVILSAIIFAVIDIIINRDCCMPPVSAMAGIAIGGFIYIIFFEWLFPTTYLEYKVTISDEVSMVEFYDKYEIIDVDGEIYTIKDKDIKEE